MPRAFEAVLAVVDEILIVTAAAALILYIAYDAGYVDASTAAAVAAVLAAAAGAVGLAVIRAHTRKPLVGPEAMVGLTGVAIEDLDPEGKVLVEGEIWRALSVSGKIERGSRVVVVDVEDLTLLVRRA